MAASFLSVSPVSASLATALLAAVASAAAQAPAAPPGLPRLGPDTSLLVVAPHPDDETLCCAGIIQRVLRSGGRVSVVWITSGDGSVLDLILIERSLRLGSATLRDLGARRMREARAASARLGVGDSGQLFLGYPDRGLERLLTDHRESAYTSPFTGVSRVPYEDALFPNHPYTGASLERDFAAVLERAEPTLILAPSARDAHPDHRAAGALTLAVSARHGRAPVVRYWIVHGGEGWPSPRDLLPGAPLTPAPRGGGLPVAVFALEPAEEDRMLDAVREYRTQMRTIAPFLLAFVRSTELFAALPGSAAP
jgi:LmbE family N-acetylglucosaminyl deacetylase